jgi:type IV fimbrial biogenesis protein FimT
MQKATAGAIMGTLKTRTAASCGGYGVVELLTVLAVAAILLSVALPAMQATRTRHLLGSATNELQMALDLARSEALASGRRAAVAPLDGKAWSSGWQVFRDDNDNGRLDGDEAMLRQFHAPDAGLSFTFAGSLSRQAISYSEIGLVKQPGSGGLALGRIVIALHGSSRTACFSTGRARFVEGTGCARNS